MLELVNPVIGIVVCTVILIIMAVTYGRIKDDGRYLILLCGVWVTIGMLCSISTAAKILITVYQ